MQKRGEPLPVSTVTDPVDRTVDFNPPKGHYNPRHMIAGREEASCKFCSFMRFNMLFNCYYYEAIPSLTLILPIIVPRSHGKEWNAFLVFSAQET